MWKLLELLTDTGISEDVCRYIIAPYTEKNDIMYWMEKYGEFVSLFHVMTFRLNIDKYSYNRKKETITFEDWNYNPITIKCTDVLLKSATDSTHDWPMNTFQVRMQRSNMFVNSDIKMHYCDIFGEKKEPVIKKKRVLYKDTQEEKIKRIAKLGKEMAILMETIHIPMQKVKTKKPKKKKYDLF